MELYTENSETLDKLVKDFQKSIVAVLGTEVDIITVVHPRIDGDLRCPRAFINTPMKDLGMIMTQLSAATLAIDQVITEQYSGYNGRPN